ncbi:MAG: hypothetical protein V4675_19220 [Verrucomicrobiota bacterium]
MKRTNITNIVLGIIAAEVVIQTMQAFANRPFKEHQSLRHAEQPEPQEMPRRFLLGEALSQVAGLLRRLFSGSDAHHTNGSQAGREQAQSLPVPDAEGRNTGKQRGAPGLGDRSVRQAHTDGREDGEIQLKGSMEGIAEKLKDPAWAGVLASNHGNVALTDAERAVPMPDSAQFVERLDKNPFIGQGMKDHSRDKI